MAQFHKILIQLPGCNEFTEKFPGGSPAAAKQLAASRYLNAKRIEWKGSTQSDEEEAATAKFFADYDKSVQDTYARQAAQTAATWEHQRQLDARCATRSVSAPSASSDGGSVVGLAILGAIGLSVMVVGQGIKERGITGAVTAPLEVIGAFVDGFTNGGSKSAPGAPTARPAAPTSAPNPCAIWADANPTLAAQLTPGERCYGF